MNAPHRSTTSCTLHGNSINMKTVYGTEISLFMDAGLLLVAIWKGRRDTFITLFVLTAGRQHDAVIWMIFVPVQGNGVASPSMATKPLCRLLLIGANLSCSMGRARHFTTRRTPPPRAQGRHNDVFAGARQATAWRSSHCSTRRQMGNKRVSAFAHLARGRTKATICSDSASPPARNLQQFRLSGRRSWRATPNHNLR